MEYKISLNKANNIEIMRRIVLISYVLVMIVQILFFVPYSQNIIFAPKESSPVIQSVNTIYRPINYDLSEANRDLIKYSKKAFYGSRTGLYFLYKLDIHRFLIQVLVTTLIFLALYMCFLKPKIK